MLVKLGDVWVDPTQVVFIDPGEHRVSIMTTKGCANTLGNADDFASIVNKAGQSFGGEDETPKEA